MDRRAKVALILLAVASVIAGAQSPTKNQGRAQQTQASGYWVDPSSGLMWAGKDNGTPVTWNKAMKFCHAFRLAGYSDWRIATLDELASLVDKSAPTSERVGNSEILYINVGRHVRGSLNG